MATFSPVGSQSARPSTTHVPHPAPVYVKSSVNAMPYQLDNLAQKISQEYTPQDLALNDHHNLDQFIQTDDSGNRILRLQFDMHLFRPEEVSVKTDDQMLTVSAVQVDSKDGKNAHVTTNEYLRCYRLPDDINHDFFNSHLSKDGILYVDAIIGQPVQSGQQNHGQQIQSGQQIHGQQQPHTTIAERTEAQQTFPDGTRVRTIESSIQDVDGPAQQDAQSILDNYGAAKKVGQSSVTAMEGQRRGSFGQGNQSCLEGYNYGKRGSIGQGNTTCMEGYNYGKRGSSGQSSSMGIGSYGVYGKPTSIGRGSMMGCDGQNFVGSMQTGSAPRTMATGNVYAKQNTIPQNCDMGYEGQNYCKWGSTGQRNTIVGYEGQHYGSPLGARYSNGPPSVRGAGCGPPGACGPSEACRMPHHGSLYHQGMKEIPVHHY